METDLATRIARLEKSNRRQRWFTLGTLVLLVTGCLALSLRDWPPPARAHGANTDIPDVIRSKSFQLLDQKGKARAWLMNGRNGATFLSLADTMGKARIAMTVEPDGSSVINLADAQGKARVALGLDAGGMPSLVFTDALDKLHWKAP
ncbi:MAG: hypothetical protein ISR64_09965 [Deltaproteobacteria bacterium]|nr:hypothetical protein [Deltaproteobacteria bacterium]